MRLLPALIPVALLSCGQVEPAVESTLPADSTTIHEPVEYLLSAYTSEEELYFTDQHKKVIIPEGKYLSTTSDTIRQLGFVMDTAGRWLAINNADSVLFEVFNFDNGPDYVEEGLFRIVDENGLIGFANENGDVVIEPKYKCAWPFEEGSAKVAIDCDISTEHEMTRWESDGWFYIDKEGYRVKPGSLHRLPGQD